MATAGLRTALPNPAWSCVRCAGEMIAAARRLPPHWQVRVGLHVSPVVAGVVGRRKYQYDVWGDTVNLAARMQQAAQPGSICVPAETWRLLQGQCPAVPMGFIDIRARTAMPIPPSPSSAKLEGSGTATRKPRISPPANAVV